jgi:RecQ family ATP-dependent DNA helicase
MSLFHKIARSYLNSIFDDVVKGKNPSSWHTFIHRLMAGGPELFRNELMQMVEERSADDMLVFLKALRKTSLKDWIPVQFFPRFVFLDLEYCQRSKRISEMAVLVTDGLEKRKQAKTNNDPSGFSKQALSAFLERALPAEPFTFVGHSVVPKLKASGLSWNPSVLDSQELSLLTYPAHSSQSLVGTDSTISPVNLSLQRLEELDRVWMSRPIEQVRLLHSHLEEGGLKYYFSWVLFRRPKKTKASISVEEYLGTTDMTEPTLLSVNISWLRQSRPGELSQRLLSTDDVYSLWVSAVRDKKCYAFSRQSVRELRQTIVNKTDSLLVPGTALQDDRSLLHSALLKELTTKGWDFTLAFLACWKRAGGKKDCELHPFLEIKATSTKWEHLFQPSLAPSSGVLEHPLWLNLAKKTEAVFECEEFTESIAPYPHQIFSTTDRGLAGAVTEFLETRVLSVRQVGQTIPVLINDSVRNEAAFKKMLAVTKERPSSPFRTTLEQTKTTILTIRQDGEQVTLSVLDTGANIEQQATKLRRNLRAAPLFTSRSQNGPLLRPVIEHSGLQFLKAYFDAVVAGAKPSLITLFLRYAADAAFFQTQLMQLVEERSADEMLVFLKAIKEIGLGDWIPDGFFPRLVFLDIEYCSDNKNISEIAVRVTAGLEKSKDVERTSNPRGLSRQELRDFFQVALPPEPFTLVGHNLLQFDLLRLKDFGRSWSHRVLDTLQLSLLSHPTRSSHSLGSGRNALSVVERTLQQLKELDRYWMKQPIERVRLLHEKLEEGGLKDYFAWVLFRRPKTSDAPLSKGAHLVKTEATKQKRPFVNISWLDEYGPGQLCQRTLSKGDAYDLWITAVQDKKVYALSRQSVQALRQIIANKTGSLLVSGTGLQDDYLLEQKALFNALKTPEWSVTLAYLACWNCAGGEKACELHPCLDIRPESTDWEHLFRPSDAPPSGVLEHALWLERETKTEAVFDCEEFTDSISFYPHRSFSTNDPGFSEAVKRFLETREISLHRQEGQPLAVLINERVRENKAFRAMEEETSTDFRTVLGQTKATILTIQQNEDKVVLFVLDTRVDLKPQFTSLQDKLCSTRLFTGRAQSALFLQPSTERSNLDFLSATLDAVVEGVKPSLISLFLHYGGEAEVFRTELMQLLQARPAEDTLVFLRALNEIGLGDWIPAGYFPRFVFLDIEYCPHNESVKEVAVLVTDGLVKSNDARGSSNPRGLSSQALSDFFESALPPEPFTFVGHNLIQFDMPKLAKFGLSWSHPVVDTLELSLLTHPTQASHSLGGAHTALSDVETNLQFLQELDQLWMRRPIERVGLLHDKLEEGGLKDYLAWVLFRRPKSSDTPLSTKAYLQTTEGTKPNVPTVNISWLEQTGPGQLSQRTLSTDDAYNLWVAAVQGKKVFAFARQSVHTLRQVIARKTNSLLAFGTGLQDDSCLHQEALLEELKAPEWNFTMAYLACWKSSGGEKACELHPFLGIRPEATDWEHLFEPSAAHSSGVLEHALWLEHGMQTEAVFDCEELTDHTAHTALYPRQKCSITDTPLSKAARKFLETRVLSVQSGGGQAVPVLINDRVRKEAAFKKMMRIVDRKASSSFRAALNQSETTVLTIRQDEEHVLLSVVDTRAGLANLVSRLEKGLSSTRLFTSCSKDSPLLRPFMEQNGLQFLETPTEHKLKELQVASDGTSGSFASMPRALMVCAEYLLGQPTWNSLVLGFGQDFQLALATAFRLSGLEAHHSRRFGSQRKTVERTANNPAPFLGGWTLSPLPDSEGNCFISRLPFPSRTDPQIEIAAANKPERDVYRELVIPMMLRRLCRVIGAVHQRGLQPILLDKRAINFGFERDIANTVAPLREMSTPEVDLESLAEVQSHLREKLEELQLAKPRELFKAIDPKPVLKRLLGPDAGFRGRQEDVVKRILKGEDLLAVLPTGSGKSICFQVPALIYGELADRLTVVFSPLRALMRDQVDGLRRRGIQGVDSYHGGLADGERQRVLRDLRNGWTVLLYMAPEQLLNPTLQSILLDRGVGMVVVDEAHCLSEWGHDFRPEYQKIKELVEQLREKRAEERPQIVAFTATATKLVQKELVDTLALSTEPVVVPVKRPNLHPVIRPVPDAEADTKIEQIVEFIRARADQSGLVYVTTRKDTEQVCSQLKERCKDFLPPEMIGYLHAGVPNRPKVESDFIKDEGITRVLVCTTAFGMGIDKKDIAWIIHVDSPGSIEAYAQETGRAGRDHELQAELLALVCPNDIKMRKDMSDPLDESDVEIVLQYLRSNHPHSGLFQCDLLRVSDACGLVGKNKEKARTKAKVCLFALERAGVLRIEGWGNRTYHLKPGLKFSQGSQSALSDLEQSILAKVRETAGVAVFNSEKYSAEHLQWSEAEVERSVRGLLKDGMLRTERWVKVRRNSKDPRKRLDRWDRHELVLADWLEQKFEERPRITFRYVELVSEMGQGAKLETLERILCWWRARRLVFQERGLLDVRLSRNQRIDFLEEVRSDQQKRCEILGRLCQHWMNRKNDFSWDKLDEKQRSGLMMLEERGIVSFEDQACPPQGQLRIEFQASPEQDRTRLRSLNLRVKQRAARYRLQELARFLSKPREGEKVWTFLQKYFDKDSDLDPKAKNQRAKILRNLTSQQKQAVEASSTSPLLINAGAGTGKTHVLARRLLYLQAVEMIDPRQILMLSFSRAGAAAIGQRVNALAKEIGLFRVRSYTFHSFCFNLVRLFGDPPELIKERRVPAGMSTNNWEAEQYLNEVLVKHYDQIFSERESLNTRVQTIDAYSKIFDAIRSGHPELDRVVILPADLSGPGVPPTLQIADGEGKLPTAEVRLAFEAYLDKLQQLKKIDFAGMVVNCLALLKSNLQVRNRLRSGIRHLLVDEFQDTSRAQEEIMREIVGPTTGLTVVGDSDQTIYTFNGSDVRNILEFEQRNQKVWANSETLVLPLEENFRSTPRILNVANRLIRQNKERIDKDLRSSSKQKNEDRKRYIKRNLKVQLFQVHNLDEGVSAAYHTVLKWLKLGVKPHEIAVLARKNPPNTPEKAVLNQLEQKFLAEGVPVSSELKRDQKQLARLLKKACKLEPLQELLEPELFLETKAGRVFKKEELSFLKVALQEAKQMGIESIRDWYALAEAACKELSGSGLYTSEGLHLKTIHSVKGEEYRRVFILHLADKFFPHAASRGDIEEERRLLYVAITRGEELVALSGEKNSVFFREMIEAGGKDLKVVKGDWDVTGPSESETTEASA